MKSFETLSNGKFREFEKGFNERPTDTYMRDYVSSILSTSINESRVPIEKDVDAAKSRLTALELDL